MLLLFLYKTYGLGSLYYLIVMRVLRDRPTKNCYNIAQIKCDFNSFQKGCCVDGSRTLVRISPGDQGADTFHSFKRKLKSHLPREQFDRFFIPVEGRVSADSLIGG